MKERGATYKDLEPLDICVGDEVSSGSFSSFKLSVGKIGLLKKVGEKFPNFFRVCS